MNAPLAVDLGAEVCSQLDASSQREWLVTNGLGGFASGTVAGMLTRRYHGLLVAALPSPDSVIGARTLLVSKFDETIRYAGGTYTLGTNRWADGSISPDGFRLIERFHLQGTVPVWTFACADALIEKRVWMQDGANTTFVRYELTRSSAEPAEIEIKALVNYRDFHGITRANATLPMNVTAVKNGLCVMAREGATPFYVLSDAAAGEPKHDWYLNFELAEERSRGLEDCEDHLLAGVFRARLAPGIPVTMLLSTDPQASLDGAPALASQITLEEKHLDIWAAAQPQASVDAPLWIRQLVLGATQFPVRVPEGPQSGVTRSEDMAQKIKSALPAEAPSYLVIAGYPWFGAWGRDTMIALPGLAITTGRADVARAILRRASGYVDQGMLPNQFPEAGQPAQYNSVDAALWYFDALRQYHDATPDDSLPAEVFSALAEIVDQYVRGTRYSIHMDKADGLLHAGETGVQLTWMDAKVGDHVITPRIGKAIEVNALWYNALRTMARFAQVAGKPGHVYSTLADRAAAGFARFWNAETGHCFDVLDGPHGNDISLRPNQLLAVSLPESPLSDAQCAAVVDVCERRLLTPFGLRSLASDDPRYQGHYGGSQAQRDTAYHQGTAWAWLLGPFVLAHLRVYHDAKRALTFLEPMAGHLLEHGLGSVSEIFDGDPPFSPQGAPAQAWSVAEVLRAWHACRKAASATSPPTVR